MTATMDTAVAFFIFNRPEHASRVFAEIAKARPRTLLVVADGPRAGRAGEAELCARAREVLAQVDWDCRLLTNLAPNNLGCGARVSSGLDWVFAQVEEAIILEDDCLPHPEFFPFCEALLARYRSEERVMMISGVNVQPGPRNEASYYFGRFCGCWGWATWRRAWRHYDFAMTAYPDFVAQGRIGGILPDAATQRRWLAIFDRVRAGKIDTWDYQWVFAVWARDGVSAMPNVNLVSNIGFGRGATHTTNPRGAFANLPTAALGTLRHPAVIAPDAAADFQTFATEDAPAKSRSALRRAWQALVGLAGEVG